MTALSLIEFDREMRRKECVVCDLPDDVREQLKKARDKKITRATQMRWLLDVVGIKLDETALNDALTTHNNGNHDPR